MRPKPFRGHQRGHLWVDIGRIIGAAGCPQFRKPRNVKSTVRKPTQDEVGAIPVKWDRERSALVHCQAKVRELGLAMEITGAEFQFDGKKLTFYYSASKYVDFRNLVKGLFRMFGTRIWMVWFDGNAPVKDVFSRGAEDA
jgi:cell fate regulator YaaT (PSP1 superfamily)